MSYMEFHVLLSHKGCTSAEEQALERQWLELRLKTTLTTHTSGNSFITINDALKNRTFLASNELTLVDILWVFSLAPYFVSLF